MKETKLDGILDCSNSDTSSASALIRAQVSIETHSGEQNKKTPSS